MRQYARRRSWKVVKAVEDVGSGASERPQREELIKAARRRQIDAILVWRLDRLRELAHLNKERLIPAKRKNNSPFRNKLELDCDPPSDQNDVIIRQPEEVADVYGVTLHRDIQSFLQFCQSSRILARDDCAVANVVDHIVEVQGV
jgi:Resolvase, N terminal domain